MIGVRDVAERAGVSIATVSRVLNGTAVVSEPLRNRVLAVADELGYQATFAARSLRMQRTHVIGLVLPPLANPYFPAMIDNVNRVAHDLGYRVLISASDELEEDVATLIQARMVDGLLVVGVTSRSRVGAGQPDSDDGDFDWTIPVVAIDRAPLDSRVPLVTVDNQGGAITVVNHLVELGHRKIAHISGPVDLSVSQLRLAGFRMALRDADLRQVDEYLVEGDFGEQSGYRAAWRLARLTDPPTAVFCANDMMAIGALKAFKEAGLSVPAQIAVVGFDGLELSGYVSPALTTLVQPIGEITRIGLRMLLDQVDGAPALDGRVIQVPGKLVKRESSQGLDA